MLLLQDALSQSTTYKM